MELCGKCLYGRKATIGRTIITNPNGTQEVLNENGTIVFICDRPWAANRDRDAGTCSEFKEKGENLQCQMEKKLSG